MPSNPPQDSSGRRTTRSSTKPAPMEPPAVPQGPKPRKAASRPATKVTTDEETTIATADAADAVAVAGVPASQAIADKAKGKGKLKKSSVQRAAEDQAAEEAGTPEKLTRTERALKESGVLVAPPPRARLPTATIPPPPPAKAIKRIRDDGSQGGQTSMKIAEANEDKRLSSATKPADADQNIRQEENMKVSTVENVSPNIQPEAGDVDIPELNIQPATQESISRGSDHMDLDSTNLSASEVYGSKSNVKRSRSNSADSNVSHASKISRGSSDLQGASRVEGGFSRGRALGNVMNLADMRDNSESFDVKPDIMGKVLIYDVRDINVAPYTMVKTTVTSTFRPILERIGEKLANVPVNNCQIFVFEEDMWCIKGNYETALYDSDPVPWINEDGKYKLPVYIKDVQQPPIIRNNALGPPLSRTPSRSTSVASAAYSGSRSASVASFRSDSRSASGHPVPTFSAEEYEFAEGSLQLKLAQILNIHPALTVSKKKADIRMLYAKYLAIDKAKAAKTRMIDDTTWPIKENVTNRDIIQIFMSPAAYYDNAAKVFPNVFRFPEMQDWLSGKEGGPSAAQVWGNRAQTFTSLQEILDAHDPDRQKKVSSLQKPKEASTSKKSKEKTPSLSSASDDIAAVDSPIPKSKSKGKQVDGRKKDEKKDKKRRDKSRE
ncbi:hypothetical protein BD410DRAFT_843913 [Rickenella mellea]|uniref:Uncharacterized protein n=1 Tax=Rickenella mellea TaxID=50990 RepID=A0A4Y7PQ14_9AGAM|nr:hypothetical protein BD410DRAFT_843913 [Rickenella mellea]